MRISDWSSDVCSSDLTVPACPSFGGFRQFRLGPGQDRLAGGQRLVQAAPGREIGRALQRLVARLGAFRQAAQRQDELVERGLAFRLGRFDQHRRSEEHTSELQSLMRISYAVFCLKKKKITYKLTTKDHKH